MKTALQHEPLNTEYVNYFLQEGFTSPEKCQYLREEDLYFMPKSIARSIWMSRPGTFTKEEENKLTLRFQTYAGSVGDILSYKKTNENQFFTLRRYINTTWVINKKIPLLVFASSWEDKKYGIQRFCGASELKLNDKESEKLLSSSPHYYLFSYKVVNVEDE